MSQSPLIVKYERALAEDPRSRAFAPLAEAYRKVGLIDKAFEVLKKGIRYNPDYIMGYLSLSQCYFEKGEFALAYTTLRPLSAKNRDNLKLQNLYGEVCVETGNFEEALDTFKYLLFINPKNNEISHKVQELESRLSESAILSDVGEVSFDIQDLSPSPENDKALDDWIQIDLSRQSEAPDKLDGAQMDEEQWMETPAPNVHEEQDRPEENLEATRDLEVDEEVDDTPVITHTLVDLYLNQGHTEKAIEILEKIIQIQPDNQESIDRLMLLKGPESDGEAANEASTQDEGHSKLSAVLDEALSDESDSKSAVLESKHNEIGEVLFDFLGLLRIKSRELSVEG